MSLLMDEDGIPYGWEDVQLTEEELDCLCAALDCGDEETAERVVEWGYDRLFVKAVN